jgi:hypothetical protein
MLLILFSEVPGLKVAANRKKRRSKSVDHSSTQPPAHERIKAQLKRRMQRKRQVQQVDSMEAAPQPARRTHQEGATFNKEDRSHEREQKGVDEPVEKAVERPDSPERDVNNEEGWEEEIRAIREEELEIQAMREEESGKRKKRTDRDVDTEKSHGWGEGMHTIREELEKRMKRSDWKVDTKEGLEEEIKGIMEELGMRKKRTDGDRGMDGQGEMPVIVSQDRRGEERPEKGRVDERESGGSSSQRQVHQTRLEALSQEKRSQKRPSSPLVEDSVTESESEVEAPQIQKLSQMKGKKQVSLHVTLINALISV